MTINKFIIYLTIVAVFFMIGIPSLCKVVNSNHERLYLVNDKKVIEAAEKCYYERSCKESKITLEQLYEAGYLKDEITDPITKEVYDSNSYVEIKKEESNFYHN